MQNFMIIIRADENKINPYEGRAVADAIKTLKHSCTKDAKCLIYSIKDEAALDKLERELARVKQ